MSDRFKEAYYAQEDFILRVFSQSGITLVTLAFWGIISPKTTVLYWIVWMVFSLTFLRIAFAGFLVQKVRFVKEVIPYKTSDSGKMKSQDDLDAYLEAFYIPRWLYLVSLSLFFLMVFLKILEAHLEIVPAWLQGTVFFAVVVLIRWRFVTLKEIKSDWKDIAGAKERLSLGRPKP